MPRRLLIAAGRLLRRAFAACAGLAEELYWPPGLREATTDDPRVCRWCQRSYACADDWTATDDEHWRVRMRCGQCGYEREVLLSNTAAARLEERLAADMDAIARDAARLDAERMADEVEAFLADLRAGRVAPADFALRPR